MDIYKQGMERTNELTEIAEARLKIRLEHPKVVFNQSGKVAATAILGRRDLHQLAPKVTHSMDVSKVSGRLFLYQCACGERTLSVRRHNNIQRGICPLSVSAMPATTDNGH